MRATWAATRDGPTGSASARRGAASRRCWPSSTPWASTRPWPPPRGVGDDDDPVELATVAFAHCPFRDLAEQRPDLLCSLHRGLIEGLVDQSGQGEVVGFGSLVDRTPCQVEIRIDGAPQPAA